MVDAEQRIRELEDELKKTIYNKATQHHIGLVKAKIAKLREAVIKKASGGKKGEGYAVKKSGDASVILIGFPSVGKSTLLNKLTKAESRVGTYDFTTLTVIPGLMEYKNAKIQVLDVPGIVHGAASGKGRGKEVLAVMRSADMAVILLDVSHSGHLKALQKEIFDTGVRINQQPPDIKIVKKTRGGMTVASTLKLTHIDEETIRAVMAEYRLLNADIVIRENITVDQLIDVLEGNRVYMPAVVVINKMDLASPTRLEELRKNLKPDMCIAAEKNVGIEALRDIIYERLRFIRIHTKEVGKKADMDVPLIMREGCTVKDVCEKLHRDFAQKFRFARVWGSAKFPGQKLALGYKVKDKDIVEVHVR